MAKKDYSKLEKEELINIIEKLESRKRYGLVWDEERTKEQFEKESENALPVLREVKSKEIITDPNKPINILIEGDNYHALSVLNYTHNTKIDVIYIDPPYNTGAKDWKYNNNYVDINDAWRHSKWLSFMSKRLRLAKSLLADNGILICSIDDNEFANLKLLLEEIFPFFTHEVIVVNHHPQGSGGDNVSLTHEYAIISVPVGKHLFIGSSVDSDIEEWSLIKAGAGRDYHREGRPKMFFAIHINKKTGKAMGVGPELDLKEKYDIEDTKEGYKRVYPLDSKGRERRWRYGRDTMVELVKKGKIIASLPSYSMKVIISRKGSYKPVYSNWTDSKYNAGPHGTTLLKKILKNSDFSFPKSLHTIIDLIAAATRLKKDAVVLDFFAGSGTTAHAVLELNKSDPANRSFILCTNNENKICEDVCYPRVSAVIKGYKDSAGDKIGGLGGNLKYFKTAFVKKSINSDQLKINITNKCTEMLCLKEGIFEPAGEADDYKIFKQGDRVMAVYYSFLNDSLKGLKKKLDKMTGDKTLYCFTLDQFGLDKNNFIGWDDVTLEPIPQKILDVYEEIYEY